MKKILLLAALAAGTATAARAQTTPATDASGVPLINRNASADNSAPPAPASRRRPQLPPDQLADRQSQRLTQALGLSPDQQAKVRQIIFNERTNDLNAQQQLQATGARRGLGRVKKAGRAQADDQLRGVLTPDQYARYQQLLAQRRQQGQGRQGQAPSQNSSGGPLD